MIPITTEEAYQQALERLEVIFDAIEGTPEGEELKMPGIAIDQYENGHFPIDLADPNV